MEYRLATAADAFTLARLREAQLHDEGPHPDVDISDACDAFFRQSFADDSLLAWVAEEEGEIVATCAAMLLRWPPSYHYTSGRVAYLHSVYTRPDHRRRGISKELIRRTAQTLEEDGYARVFLRASIYGRPVYEAMGFVPDSETMNNWEQTEL